tara:strand:- start:241 stop:963 length:723 start_codon:yes stop_codon:yes gene_type:complete
MEDIPKLISERPVRDLTLTDHLDTPSKTYPSIKKFYLSTKGGSGCKLEIIPDFRPNVGEHSIEQIIDTFFQEPLGGMPLDAGEATDLNLIDVLIGVAKTENGANKGNLLAQEGPSTLDIEVKGPEVFLLEIQVDNLFVDPEILSFKDPKTNTHKFYRHCKLDENSYKRFAFSLKGDQEHKDHLKVIGNSATAGDKFNLHLVYTLEGSVANQADRRHTRIILDPKARDGGSPPPPPPPPGP